MPGRPKEFDRETVLTQALDVFWSRGYDGTSLDDLTTAMGIGRGSLYNEFGDKHTLFLQALDRYRSERIAGLEQILASAPSAREGIAATLRRTVDGLWADSTRRGCLMVNSTAERAGSDPDVAARAAEAFERTTAAFRASLERGRRSGELDPELDVRATAHFLASTVNSLRLLARIGDRAAADDVVAVTLTTLDG